jgi:hypothetical protein
VSTSGSSDKNLVKNKPKYHSQTIFFKSFPISLVIVFHSHENKYTNGNSFISFREPHLSIAALNAPTALPSQPDHISLNATSILEAKVLFFDASSCHFSNSFLIQPHSFHSTSL